MHSYLELIKSPDKEIESRKYLLKNSDTLRLTRKYEWHYGFFTQGKIFSRYIAGDESNPNYKILEQIIAPNIIKIKEESQE